MKKEEGYVNFENSLAPWLGRTGKIVDYYIMEMLKEVSSDLTKEQMVVLKKLHDENGISQNELAFLTYRDKSTLARLLSKMEKKGYITRTASNSDKRVNNVFLTLEGKEVFKQVRPVLQQIVLTMEKQISEEEKQQVIDILKRVQQNFKSSFKSL